MIVVKLLLEREESWKRENRKLNVRIDNVVEVEGFLRMKMRLKTLVKMNEIYTGQTNCLKC